MSTSWDPKSPSLLPAIVCHADILGFSNQISCAVKSSNPQSTEKMSVAVC